MLLRTTALAAAFLLLAATGADAAKGKIQLLDADGLSHGFVTAKLGTGLVTASFSLDRLPAQVGPLEDPFEATLYKAYLNSSLDPAIEIPVGDVYPNSRGKGRLKAALKGDVSGLGLDRFVIVAYSKDGLRSFDVLTGTLVVQ